VGSVYSPDGVTPVLLVIGRDMEAVVEGGDDEKEPCEDGEDLVGPDGLSGMGLASREWVHCRCHVSWVVCTLLRVWCDLQFPPAILKSCQV
jgi:hypothetical protein